MKRIIWGIALSALVAGSANAALLSRAGGQAYYDTVLDITWVADANLAWTSDPDDDGMKDWAEAQMWIASLNTANYLGVNNWRLPNIVDTDAPGCDFGFSGTDCGYNVDLSTGEMAYLFYGMLGNLAYYDTSGVALQPGWGLTNTGPFSNVQPHSYWSGTTYLPGPNDSPDINSAWDFHFQHGAQGHSERSNTEFIWPVRNGDIGAVPVPSALWLFGTGLVAVAAKLRRREDREAE